MRPDALCGHCGGPFEPTRPWSRYCSPECRKAAHRARKVERIEERVAEAVAADHERVLTVVREALERRRLQLIEELRESLADAGLDDGREG